MNGDLQDLMTHIGDLHNEQMEAIGKLREDFAGFKGNMSARVDALEKYQAKQDNRQWLHSAVVLVINTLHHTLGTHFGWKV